MLYNLDMLGLSSEKAKENLESFGLNKIEERKKSLFKKALLWFLSPISLMLLAAAFLSLISGKIFDFYFIIFLLLFNFIITFIQEKKADDAIEKLQDKLRVKVDVLRDGKWITLDSYFIVPDDVIRVGIGDIIPADCIVLSQDGFSVNQAALTGESLPQEKKVNDKVFSGSFVFSGNAILKVINTGKNTYIGKSILSIEDSKKESIVEKDIILISKFLSFVSLVAVLIISIFLYTKGTNFIDIFTIDLSLVIAGIPVAISTVITIITSIGVYYLSKKDVVVRRLSSLEDLANVNLLLTDKTGTLTKNEMSVTKIKKYASISEEEFLFYAYLSSFKDAKSPISKSIVEFCKKASQKYKTKYEVLKFIPADSNRKRSTAFAKVNERYVVVSLGAPQVIVSLCKLSDDELKKINEDLNYCANQGLKPIALAFAENSKREGNMQFLGLLLLSDPLREDAKDVIEFMKEHKVRVKMLTGDTDVVGKSIGRALGLSDKDIYTEILPKDKLDIVMRYKKRGYIVAVTGDGINDLPAIKVANVGIAVSNAVSALKSAADIVLLSKGISVIADAILEARKIFARMYSYSIYRISESFRVILTIFILVLIYKEYPLSPIHLILLAFLNDIPITSLAFNRVRLPKSPSKIKVKKRFILSSILGFAGVLNSIIFFVLMIKFTSLTKDEIATLFFLKLAVSGHMLLYVAHTEKLWFKFLPSKEVIASTFGTQILATIFALFGIFIAKAPALYVLFVWIWSLVWMQVSELFKQLYLKKYD